MRVRTIFAIATVACVGYASKLQPQVLPLFVRNPYLSAWLGHARDNPWDHWPIFWTGQELGFAVLAAIPDTGAVYPLLGRPHDSLAASGKRYGRTSEATQLGSLLTITSSKVKYAKYLGSNFDASTTNLTYEITGPSLSAVTINLSFLSPITPTSTFRQSIPAAYLSVEVAGDFDIDIYLDVNGQWASFDRGRVVEWQFNETEHTKSFKVQRAVQQVYTEFNDRAEWGSLHITGPSDVQYEAGTSGEIRSHFAKTRSLRNKVDDNFRPIMQDEPVFAFAKSFKLAKTARSKTPGKGSALFTIAHIQDQVIRYASPEGAVDLKPLWKAYEDTAESLLAYHYHDFHTVASLAQNYSDQLEIDALQSGSEDYKDILALSARQVMGACSFTGTPKNPLIFYKEISSDGNMNTVDVIYPSFPFFLYTNPRWLAYLLQPLLEHQLSGQYPNDYSMHDLGSSFPNATGHPDGRDEYMPVEECGNMLIMGLALANALRYEKSPPSLWSSLGHAGPEHDDTEGIITLSTDSNRMDDAVGGHLNVKGHRKAREWLRKSYPIWKQWTGYLVREALIPSNQLSTDDFAGWLANNTNLALKGILGIRAMSELAAIVGETDEAISYYKTSREYITRWHTEFAMSRDGTHAKLAYTWYGSWSMLYNLFADSLLCFHLPASSGTARQLQKEDAPVDEQSHTAFVPSLVYTRQSEWYLNVLQKYGIPLDSRHLYTKSDWEFFAVSVASKQVREEVIDRIALWVNETTTDKPLTDLYDTESEWYPGIEFKARPVVGGHFAYLALERACGGRALEGLKFLDDALVEDARPARAREQLERQHILSAEEL